MSTVALDGTVKESAMRFQLVCEIKMVNVDFPFIQAMPKMSAEYWARTRNCLLCSVLHYQNMT